MKRIRFLRFISLLIIVLLSGCSVTSVPDDVMSAAIKKDVNLRQTANYQGNYLFKDTQVNEFEVTDCTEQKTSKGTYEVVGYTAKVTLVDSKTMKSVDKDVKGTIEFIKKEGHWWSESVKLPTR